MERSSERADCIIDKLRFFKVAEDIEASDVLKKPKEVLENLKFYIHTSDTMCEAIEEIQKLEGIYLLGFIVLMILSLFFVLILLISCIQCIFSSLCGCFYKK
jgi:hypothetical protein